jgi:hypothetical protein
MNPVEGIIARLTDCERDLLLGRGSWGAWVTATYPMLIAKGLMSKHIEGNTLVISHTPLGQQVRAALEDPSHAD